MNKQRRNELTKLKYKKRLKRWISCGGLYHLNGEWVDKPNVTEAMRENVLTAFKSSATLCSCFMCSGFYKYQRHVKKQEDRKAITEALNDVD
jgi:hypothetical protein